MVRENEEFRESALQESDGGSLGDDVKVYMHEILSVRCLF